MMKKIHYMIAILAALFISVAQASSNTTHRIPQFSNEKVSVWETTIYPHKEQILKMHRHDHDRILVALTAGILKVTNDKGQSHLLKLEKDHAYYLKPDVIGEEHSDENISGHPIKVMVIELR